MSDVDRIAAKKLWDWMLANSPFVTAEQGRAFGHKLIEAFAEHRKVEADGSAPVQQSPTERADAHVPITPEVIRYVQRYQGTCRDCADEAGHCPRNGIACGDSEKAILFVLEAINYGVSHGYLAAPQAAQPAEADGGRPVSEAPPACHVLAGRFVADIGEWDFAVVSSPPAQPFTHWWPLPSAATPKAPATDAGEVEAFATAQADHWLDDMQTPALGAKHVSLKAMAFNCINYGRALATPPAPNDDLRAALEGVRAWVASLPDIDMNEIVADNGITAGMVVGQEAAEQVRRIDRALKENRRG